MSGDIQNRELTMTYSHMGEPHYHWRYGVSLLSSAWGQVGPPRYCRQANSVSFQPLHLREAIRTNLGTSLKISLKTPSVL